MSRVKMRPEFYRSNGGWKEEGSGEADMKTGLSRKWGKAGSAAHKRSEVRVMRA